MKSLQVLTPHEECIFNCSFCISKTHKHDNCFINNYELNNKLWTNNLVQVIKNNHDLKCVVITGTSEPMQNKQCVTNIINIVRKTNKNIQIEIQTRYYKQDLIYNSLDVVAYSISDFNLINKIKPMGKIIRYVFIMTDTFNNKCLKDILDIIPKKVEQITFKLLHNSNGYNKQIDKWIKEHKTNNETIEKLKKEIASYQGEKSIRMDENCMDSSNRYKIFREDGLVYKDWDSKESE